MANAILAQAGLPIPRWTVAQGKIEDDFPLPAIIKPAAEDASAGLDRGSVVSDRKALRARVAAMTERFEEVLVQEYIPGTPESVWMFNGYFDRRSDCSIGITAKKIRQSPPYTGATTLGVCEANETVHQCTTRLMKAP